MKLTTDLMNRRVLRDRIRKLEDIHVDVRMTTNNPDDAIENLLKVFSEYDLCELVAAMVQRYYWDGRISGRNIEWANTWTFPTTVTENAGTNKIHMCHLDAIATRVRKLDIAQATDDEYVLGEV